MKEIEDWQEYVAALSDKQFFSIMRLYLGEIKTPYNKHRLISQLAGFIRNEKNSAAIISLLDDFDLTLLSAIFFIPAVTENILIEFFAGEYNPSKIYSGIVNLCERLLIFTKKSYEKEYLYLNPLLEDRLKPLISLEKILSPVHLARHCDEEIFQLSPNFLAALISFLKIQKCAGKLDGTLRKSDLKRLDEIFPGKQSCISRLCTAFMNLLLLYDKNGVFELDENRLSTFAALPQNQQYAFLCAASVSRFGREGLKKEALLLLDCLASVPKSGCTRSNFIKMAFIINSNSDLMNASSKSRFSRLLDSARASAAGMENSLANANLLERMFDSALEFGLLQRIGFSGDGQDIFVAADFPSTDFSVVQNSKGAASDYFPKVLNIDSTLTVSLMPALDLKTLLPFTNFMLIKKSAVVTEFEISRKSASYFFDLGKTPEDIFKLLTSFSNYEIPQILRMNIIEWFAAYSSATLYKGYVLKVSQSNIAFIENNPKIKIHLKEKLAEGVYLLDIPVDDEITDFAEQTGLEVLGSIKKAEKTGNQLPFPELRDGKNLLPKKEPASRDETASFLNSNSTAGGSVLLNAQDYILHLKETVENSDFDKYQKESLLNRISRRLIISEAQLTAGAVRTEILEAEGMDFSGKVHLIEAAIKDSDLLEITLPDYKSGENYFTIVGNALGISRTAEDAVLRFSVRPSENIENIVVSRITYLRRLKF